MRKFAALAIILLLSVGIQAKEFGKKFEIRGAVALGDVLKQPKNFIGKDIVVTGTVEKVCQTKGCWFEMKAEGYEPTRVTFANYSFVVPKDIAGKMVSLKGKLKEKELSVRAQRHYLKDAGKPEAEVAAVKEPKTVFQIVATGVNI